MIFSAEFVKEAQGGTTDARWLSLDVLVVIYSKSSLMT
jgi:hypothetical protein